MNAYEITFNSTFYWVAAETAFEAIAHILDVKDGYEREDENTIKSRFVPESEWGKQEFDDERDGANEGAKISLAEVMRLNSLKEDQSVRIIAEEYSE